MKSDKKFIAPIFLCLFSTENKASDIHSTGIVGPVSYHQDQALSLEDQLNNYMESDFILSIKEEEHTKAILECIQKYIDVKGRWPDDLSVKEEFYRKSINGIYSFERDIVLSLFSATHKISYEDFKTFFNIYGRMTPFHLSIYLAYPTPESRQGFIDFCKTQLNYVFFLQKEDVEMICPHGYSSILYLLDIYQAFSSPEVLQDFINFATPYTANFSDYDKHAEFKENLLPVYQTFPIKEDRDNFLDFFEPYLKDIEYDCERMKLLLPIYQDYLKDSASIQTFTDFIHAFNEKKVNILRVENIIRIYNTFPTNQIRIEYLECCMTFGYHEDVYWEFNDVCRFFIAVFKDFLDFNDLSNFMNFCAMYFKDHKQHKSDGGNLQSLFDVYKEFKNNEERKNFIKFCKGVDPFYFFCYINSYEKISVNPSLSVAIKNYIRIFKKYYYVHAELSKKYIEYSYLDKIRNFSALEAIDAPQEKVVKAFYDRKLKLMLPPIWEQDPFLDEKNPSKIREKIRDVTEKFESIYPKLDVILRIENAPAKAKQLFDGFHAAKQNEEKPELFEIYLAYYDALYQRTVVSDIDGKREYKKDEHILMRDDHGNLVSFYNADGTERETPHIVYYQSEFQVLEHAFTELMRQEFEEQR